MIEYGNVRVSLCLCGFYVISYEQTAQTIHLEHSQPLSVSLVVLLTSSASSAGVHEAEVEGTHQVAVTNVLASCDGNPARDTHGGVN